MAVSSILARRRLWLATGAVLSLHFQVSSPTGSALAGNFWQRTALTPTRHHRIVSDVSRAMATMGTNGGSTASSSPRIAKDDAYAAAVKEAWAADADINTGTAGPCTAVPFQYEDDGFTMYGRLVTPSQSNGAGIVVVHTAVGPHDVFLHWKADALAALGYTVLIADMLGDVDGQGWDREWGESARKPMADNRQLGQRRIRAAVAALADVPSVDRHRIGAIGFCFGGRAVLDLARLGSNAGVAAVVSFHGILDDGVPAADMSSVAASRVLICHGDADPFISGSARAACEEQLRQSGARWDMLVLGGVHHGFTNPAQALNENPAFDFDRRAASMSWSAMKSLFAETLAAK